MTHVLLELARSAAVLLAAIFTISGLHKTAVLTRQMASEEPLLRESEWRLRHASSILAAAAVIETALVIALIAVPTQAGAASAAVTAVYMLELRRASTGVPCNCLGRFLDLPNRRFELIRNGILIALSLGVTVVGLALGTVAPISQRTVGSALVALALLTAVARVAQMLSQVATPQLGGRRIDAEVDATPPTNIVAGRSTSA